MRPGATSRAAPQSIQAVSTNQSPGAFPGCGFLLRLIAAARDRQMNPRWRVPHVKPNASGASTRDVPRGRQLWCVLVTVWTPDPSAPMTWCIVLGIVRIRGHCASAEAVGPGCNRADDRRSSPACRPSMPDSSPFRRLNLPFSARYTDASRRKPRLARRARQRGY
jgi:hypothetical protein